MKHLFYSLLCSLLLFSCKKDACETVVCYNNATCQDGSCICSPGYEGSDCSTEIRTKFFGTYVGVTTNMDNGVTQNEQVVLKTYSGKASRLTWENKDLYLEVSKNNELTMPIQYVSQGSGFSFQSTEPGTLNGEVITLHWKYTSPGGTYLFSFSGTRQ